MSMLLGPDDYRKSATPAKPEAIELAEAIYYVFARRFALERAKGEVPNYTAQWSDEDYYAQEQEEYNRAADSLYELLKP